jgi:hypothetical protein
MGGKGEETGTIAKETLNIYAQEQERYHAGEIDPAFRGKGAADPNRPRMSDYQNLAAIHAHLTQYIPGGRIDGHRVDTEFSRIDMTDTKNYLTYKQAMNRMMVEQTKIMTENSAWAWWIPVPRSNESTNRYNEAQNNVNLLKAAEQELALFEQRALAYNQQKEQSSQERRLAELPAEQRERINGQVVAAKPQGAQVSDVDANSHEIPSVAVPALGSGSRQTEPGRNP